MRARAVVGSVLASVGILVGASELGLTTLSQSSTTPTTTSTTTSGSSTSSTGTGTGTTAGTGTGTGTTDTGATGSATTSANSSDGTWTGETVQTRFGPVQVQVTISGGVITDVTALQLTNHDGKSVAISNRAAPILREEVLSAQSAQVSNVSGATYTTQAYLSSLQSALDQAGF